MSNVKVSWASPDTYKTQPVKKQKVEEQVLAAPETTKAAARGATKAIIAAAGVHKSKDPKDHATVEYKDKDEKHVTTRHVYMAPP